MRRGAISSLPGLALLLAACGADDRGGRPARGVDSAPGQARLAVVLPARGQLALLDPKRGVVARVAVGESPWGVAVTGGRAYVSAARHVAVVDLARREVVARVPYRRSPGPVELGEYRAGGMGIAAAGRRVFVGVHAPGGGRGRIEVLDTRTLRMTAAARVGVRPFDVLAAPGGRIAYTVDHDSYGVTRFDAASGASRTYRVAPLGRGAFDKLNYGALDRSGRLLLPINGEVLAVLEPRTGRITTRPMRARVHQAGVALNRGRLFTVGAEALESGSGPNLSVYDLATGRERLIRLDRPHEEVAVDRDGKTAYLTGGYTRGGWRGITVVDVAGGGGSRELALDDEPLGIAVVPAPSPGS